MSTPTPTYPPTVTVVPPPDPTTPDTAFTGGDLTPAGIGLVLVLVGTVALAIARKRARLFDERVR